MINAPPSPQRIRLRPRNAKKNRVSFFGLKSCPISSRGHCRKSAHFALFLPKLLIVEQYLWRNCQFYARFLPLNARVLPVYAHAAFLCFALYLSIYLIDLKKETNKKRGLNPDASVRELAVLLCSYLRGFSFLISLTRAISRNNKHIKNNHIVDSGDDCAGARVFLPGPPFFGDGRGFD